MFKLLRLLTECKENAQKAIEQSEESSTAYHDSLARNDEAHCALMAKIDRRSDRREASAT